jgi:hypothetical protein
MKKVTIHLVQRFNVNRHFKRSNILSIGTQMNFPMSDFSNAASIGWGITGQYEFHLGGNWNGTVTSGYLGFAESNGSTYSAVPLVVGTKLYFVSGWYGIVETGLHFYNYHLRYNYYLFRIINVQIIPGTVVRIRKVPFPGIHFTTYDNKRKNSTKNIG